MFLAEVNERQTKFISIELNDIFQIMRRKSYFKSNQVLLQFSLDSFFTRACMHLNLVHAS